MGTNGVELRPERAGTGLDPGPRVAGRGPAADLPMGGRRR